MDPMSTLAIMALVFQLSDLGGKIVKKGISKLKDAQAGFEDLQSLRDEIVIAGGTLRRICGGIDGYDTAANAYLSGALEQCEGLALEIQRMLPKDGKGLPRILWTADKTTALKERFARMKSTTTDAILLSIWYASFLLRSTYRCREPRL